MFERLGWEFIIIVDEDKRCLKGSTVHVVNSRTSIFGKHKGWDCIDCRIKFTQEEFMTGRRRRLYITGE